MLYSQTSIHSEHAARYLQSLCRHFSRKVPAKWDERSGEVNFIMGDCLFERSAQKSELVLTCSAVDNEKLSTVRSILEQHITMLSRREEVTIIWVDQTRTKV